jgi:hypothetical protein
LLNFSESVENYFYCGNIMYYTYREIWIKYYDFWLQKIPDVWDKNSYYYDNFFVKNIFVYDRFISEKFSNIKQILKRKKINNNFLQE